ncbi:M24 family metallopeptidase [Thermodesulfobacteriota bacterium]
MINQFKVPATEIRQRTARIQDQMKNSGIDGLFIMQRRDLFYFSGTAQNGYLYIPVEGEPLLIIKKYMPRALEETSIKQVVELQSVKEIPSLIHDFYGRLPNVLCFEFDVLPVNEFNFYRQIFSEQEHVDGSPLIHKIRMIKSGWEIEQMERTAELSRKTFEHMRTAMQPGLKEIEFGGIYETFSRKMGHSGQIMVRDWQMVVFPWHVLSGKSGGMVGCIDAPMTGEGTSAAFPYGGGPKLLAANEPILIDFGTVLNGYHLDETRMFAIGSMPEKAMKACKVAIEIHDEILDKLKPGMTVGELFETSVNKAKLLGYSDTYLGPPDHKVSFVGHGVGLELIEHPIIAKGKQDILVPGMTLALEPKIVFENEFAAGIESVMLVTEKGCRLLSKVPVEVFIC